MRGFTVSIANADAIINPLVGIDAYESKLSRPISSEIWLWRLLPFYEIGEEN